MPLSVSLLNVESLRSVASDLGIVSAGLDKSTLVSAVTAAFLDKGFNPNDVSSMDTASSSNNKPLAALPNAHSSLINISPPPAFDVREDDRAKRFVLWLEEFESYLEVVGESGSARSKSLLLYCGGAELRRLVESHKYSTVSYKEMVDIINRKFSSPTTIPFNRFTLSEMRQNLDETTDDYVSRLRSQARFCSFVCASCDTSNEDERLFEIVLRNTSVPSIRSKAFERGIVTLENLLVLARNYETAQRQSSVMSNKTQFSEINSSRHVNYKRNFSKKQFHKPMDNNNNSSKPSDQLDIRCKFCDKRHPRIKSACPANGKRCTNCGTEGHFPVCCRTPKRQLQSTSKINSVDQSHQVDHCIYNFGKRQVFTKLLVNGCLIEFLVDTGASDNLIPSEYVASHVKLERCSAVRCYDGSLLQPLGRVELDVETSSGSRTILPFLVMNSGMPLLGLKSCLALNFVSLGPEVSHVSSLSHGNSEISNLLQKYSDLFNSDLGCVRGVTAQIQIKSDVRPRFMRHRPVPLALRDKVEKAIDDWISRGTVQPVKTSDWASPIVIVPKPDNTVRICADYTGTISRAVDTEAYPLPRPEEMYSKLAGNTIFSKLDLKTCFEQFELSEDSKPLLTVNTIKGLLQFNRLPYGISSAPAIVQRAMEELLKDCDVQVYLDDILIASKDLKSHLKKLEKVFKKLLDANIRLNFEKCELHKELVKYLGFIVSGAGISPDPAKIEAILRYPTPTSVQEVRSFLGLVRFYDKFVPKLSDLAKPLHNLLKKDVKWTWNSEQQNSVALIKESLVSAPCLHHYDPSLPIIVSTDASPVGVSAILSHRDSQGREFPVAYASRSLSAAETRYAQIDREALAIIYGVKKFSQFLLGRRFTLVTDHQPLKSIFGNKNGLPALSTARLHRYSVFLLSYNFDVEYRPGNRNSNADALSRAPVDSPMEEADETEIYLVACISNSYLDQKTVIVETSRDPILSRILSHVRNGWPSKSPDGLQSFWSKRHELSVQSDILLWGHRIIIPPKLQSRVLNELHSAHFGIVKMKSAARLSVWWPTLSQDVESHISSCTTCQLHASSPPSQSPVSWPAAEVWQRVHLDYATFERKNYLILFDAGSKWIEAKQMSTTTTHATLRALYSWFTVFGFPEEIHTDGGPQFRSFEFRSKLSEWNVKASISPPYSPESNGAAERAVRIVKDGLRKSVPLETLLFAYRSTPVSGGTHSPGFLMLGRQLRTRLSGLTPKGKSRILNSTGKFAVNDAVWIRDFRSSKTKWQPALCVGMKGRSVVLVKVPDGQIMTRHVNHARKRRD